MTTPESYGMNDDDSPLKKIDQIVASYLQLETNWLQFRKRQIRNYEYVFGNMIDEDIRAKLVEEGRPIFEFQLLKPVVQYMSGKLARDGTKAKAIPIHGGAENGAELQTAVTNDWAMQGCLGYKAMAKASLDAYIGGFGFTNNYWTLQGDPEGKWITIAMDPTSVMFDPLAKDTIRQSDMQVITYSRFYTAAEVLEIFKEDLDDDTIAAIKSSAEQLEGMYNSRLGTARAWYTRQWNASWNMLNRNTDEKRRQNLRDNFTDPQNGLYRIIEWHDKRVVSAKWMYDPVSRTQEQVPKDKENDKEYMQQILQRYPHATFAEVSEEQVWVTVIAPGLLPDRVIKEKPYPVQEQGFAIKIWTCFDYHPDITKTQGGIDSLVAPCDLFNQKTMTMLEWSMRQVNPDYIAEEESISPAHLPGWKSKARGVMRFFKRGFQAPQPRLASPGAFQALQVLQEVGLELEDKLSGIGPNARGIQESSKESGVLFEKRREQTEVMISHFFDNIQETMMQTFNYCGRNIQKFLTFPRQIRILADTDDPTWLIVNEPTIEGIRNNLNDGEYDFKPDVEALGESQRQQNFALLANIAKEFAVVDPILQLLILADIFKYGDFPNSNKYSKYCEMRAQMLMEQQGIQLDMQQKMQQLSLIRGTIDTVMSAQQPQQQKQLPRKAAA
jgi:hypothetical protein